MKYNGIEVNLTKKEIKALLKFFDQIKAWLDCDCEREALDTANKLLYKKGDNFNGGREEYKSLSRFVDGVFDKSPDERLQEALLQFKKSREKKFIKNLKEDFEKGKSDEGLIFGKTVEELIDFLKEE